jgi:acetyltransferase-like isoleucine patch superfamily enzyme
MRLPRALVPLADFVLHPLPPDRRWRLYMRWIRGWPRFKGTLGYWFLQRWFDVEQSEFPQVFGTPQIAKAPGSRIVIGRGVIMVSSSMRATSATLQGPVRLRTLNHSAAIVIGDGVSLNGTSITAHSRTIHIGDHTMVAPNCVIVDSDFHAIWPPETRLTSPGLERDADVTIGRNVWLGTRSVVLRGVTIGDGTIIGAGSVVTNDIPENVIAAGVPARVVRKLGP